MITIAALFSAGLYPQLKSHLILGKDHIRANVKHWHGAAKDSWFQHIAQEIWLFRVECG